jgi:hypothetical protein
LTLRLGNIFYNVNHYSLKIYNVLKVKIISLCFYQSKFLPRIDTYWLLQEEGEEERNWDLDLDLNSEANYEANIMPDYIKELILPNEAKDMKTLNEDMNNSGDYI